MEVENVSQETPQNPTPAETPEAETSQAEAQINTEAVETTKQNGYQGDNFVEFTPEQQKRLNQLAKKAGKSEREANELRMIAQQQSELISELSKGQQQIVNHLQTNNFTEAENQILTQQQQALEKGDLVTYNQLNGKLIGLQVQRTLAEKAPKPQVQAPRVPQGDFVEAAVQKGAISRDDAQVYRDWETETDQQGNAVRGWTNEYDPRNQTAALIGKAVFLDPTLRSKPFAEKLKEIDRRMGISTPQRTGSAVLPAGNLTGNGKTSNIKLSPWIEDVAVRKQFAGPGKSRSEHIEAYRKQVTEVRGARR